MEKSIYGATEAATEQSALEYAHAVLEEARELALRTEALADRLLGPVPTAVSGGENSPSPPAVLPSLREHAQRVRSRIQDGASALSRIERAI